MRKIWSMLLLSALLLTACVGRKPALPVETTGQPETLPEETTGQPAEPGVTAPETLTGLLAESGSDLQTLADLGCRQLITVEAQGTEAQINLYLLENDQWIRQEDLSCRGYVGAAGTKAEKQEGDKATPQGLFPVTEGFYIGEAPETALPLFQITKDTYWVDDPKSQHYNKRIEGVENKDWASAEQMIQYGKAYEYGFVIGYNPEAVPYAGSAIFFHVGDRPTAGCVATDKFFVLQYLAVLSQAQKPYIFISERTANAVLFN